MNLHDVHRGIQKHKKLTRVGRGAGSGQGKTAGRGGKGQSGRPGWSTQPTFQGGQTPLARRIPKRGFNNAFALRICAINVSDLEENFQSGDEVNANTLEARSLARQRYDVLKILGGGELNKKLTVSAHRFSASAKEKIEKAGGEVVVLPGPVTVAEKKKQRQAAASS